MITRHVLLAAIATVSMTLGLVTPGASDTYYVYDGKHLSKVEGNPGEVSSKVWSM